MVANTTASYRHSDHLIFTAQAKNLFDKNYETFGLYGEATEVLDNVDANDTRFLSPAASRTFWLGLKLHW